MREVFLNTWILLTLAILMLVSSFIVSTLTDASHWFGRAGAVTTVLGLLLTVKHNVLSSSRDIHVVVMEKRHYANWAPDRDSPAYQKDLDIARHIIRDEYLGLTLTVIGTVIWAYGDLIYDWFT